MVRAQRSGFSRQEENASGGTMQAPITAADVSVLPTLQITTDGVNWTNVSYTSNYASQLEGIYHYNEAISPVVTFVLDTPQSDIEGIRLIGETGGTSDFLGSRTSRCSRRSLRPTRSWVAAWADWFSSRACASWRAKSRPRSIHQRPELRDEFVVAQDQVAGAPGEVLP